MLEWTIYPHNQAYRQCKEVLPNGRVVLLLDYDRPHLDDGPGIFKEWRAVYVFGKDKENLGAGDGAIAYAEVDSGLLEAICVFEEYKKRFA